MIELAHVDRNLDVEDTVVPDDRLLCRQHEYCAQISRNGTVVGSAYLLQLIAVHDEMDDPGNAGL